MSEHPDANRALIGAAEDDYAHCRRLWLAGLCPCCGSEIADSNDGVAIAEGVRLCFLCEMRGHHEDDEHVRLLLEAIARR